MKSGFPLALSAVAAVAAAAEWLAYAPELKKSGLLRESRCAKVFGFVCAAVSAGALILSAL